MDDGGANPLSLERQLATLQQRIAALETAGNEQQDLGEAEAHLFDELQVGLFRWDLSRGQLVAVNQRLAESLDCSREDLLSTPSLMSWADPAGSTPLAQALRASQRVRDHELELETRTGQRRVLQVSATLDPRGGTLVGSVADITAHKQAQLALRERVKEMACLQSLSSIVDRAGDSVERMLEGAVQVLPGSWLHTDVAVARIRLDEKTYETGDVERCAAVQRAELRLHGELRGAVEVGYLEQRPEQDEGPFLREERALIEAVAERLSHIVERLEITRSLEAERSRTGAVLDAIEDVIYVADPKTHELVHVNQTFRRIWGDDCLGKKCYRVLQNREAPCPFCTNDKIFGDSLGQTHIWEFQNEVSGDWFHCTDKAIQWNDGRWLRFELAADITALKRTEQELRRSEQRFRDVGQLAPDMIYCMSLPDGAYQYVSPAAEQLFGYRPQQMLDNPLLIQQLIHPDWHGYFKREWDKLLRGEMPPTYEYQIVRPDGAVRWINQRNRLIRDAEGRPSAIWGIATDVTEAREAHLALQASQREIELRNAVATAFVEHPGDGIYDALLQVALEALSSPRGVIGFVDDRGDLCLPATHDHTNAAATGGPPRLPRDEWGNEVWARALREGRLAHSEEPHNLFGVPTQTVQRSVAAPVFHGDQLLGLLKVADKAEAYDADDLEQLQAITQAIAPVLKARLERDRQERARGAAEQELREHQAHLEQLVRERTAELDATNESLRAEVEERRQAEAALAHNARVTAAINRVFREALTCDTEQQVAQAALRVAEDLTDSRFGFIGELNRDGRLDTIGMSNPGWEACSIEGSSATQLIQGMEVRGIWGSVIKSGEPRIVNRPDQHPDRVGTPPGHPPLTAFLGVPLHREGRTVGMVALANKEGGYTEEDREAVVALSASFHETLTRVRLEREMRRAGQLKAAQVALAERLLGDPDPQELCRRALSFLCSELSVPTGLLYLADADGGLSPAAGYAHRETGEPRRYRPGEGLVGQAALEQRTLELSELPAGYLDIESGLGSAPPRHLTLLPIVYDERTCAVLELGTLEPLTAEQSELLATLSDPLAAGLVAAQARAAQQQLLEETQRLAQELQAQQEELQVTNEELEQQAQQLGDSEAALKAQQEELQVTNEELEEKNELLEQQTETVEQSRRELADKARDLARASRYKSEFLANMSHELRTPLNSLLLLADSLSANKAGNLTPDQVESAQVIYHSGNDLLSLINEILDLSKIEAGRMELYLDQVPLQSIQDALRASFQHLAQDKGLELLLEIDPAAPPTIRTDGKRLEQVLRNLVANAIKFTREGGITVSFALAPAGIELQRPDLAPGRALAIAVADTGIGIPADKHQLIFEAFQQVDGSAARRYAGTGLGLSICRELVRILGGEIQLTSAPDEGASFTVYLPLEAHANPAPREQQARPAAPTRGAPPPPPPVSWRTTATNSPRGIVRCC